MKSYNVSVNPESDVDSVCAGGVTFSSNVKSYVVNENELSDSIINHPDLIVKEVVKKKK